MQAAVLGSAPQTLYSVVSCAPWDGYRSSWETLLLSGASEK